MGNPGDSSGYAEDAPGAPENVKQTTYFAAHLHPGETKLGFKMGAVRPLTIGRVEADGWAERTGVQVGDVLESVTNDQNEIFEEILSSRAGKKNGEDGKLDSSEILKLLKKERPLTIKFRRGPAVGSNRRSSGSHEMMGAAPPRHASAGRHRQHHADHVSAENEEYPGRTLGYGNHDEGATSSSTTHNRHRATSSTAEHEHRRRHRSPKVERHAELANAREAEKLSAHDLERAERLCKDVASLCEKYEQICRSDDGRKRAPVPVAPGTDEHDPTYAARRLHCIVRRELLLALEKSEVYQQGALGAFEKSGLCARAEHERDAALRDARDDIVIQDKERELRRVLHRADSALLPLPDMGARAVAKLKGGVKAMEKFQKLVLGVGEDHLGAGDLVEGRDVGDAFPIEWGELGRSPGADEEIRILWEAKRGSKNVDGDHRMEVNTTEARDGDVAGATADDGVSPAPAEAAVGEQEAAPAVPAADAGPSAEAIASSTEDLKQKARQESGKADSWVERSNATAKKLESLKGQFDQKKDDPEIPETAHKDFYDAYVRGSETVAKALTGAKEQFERSEILKDTVAQLGADGNDANQVTFYILTRQ